ncbi:MAG: PLP-dependent aminotransferase family protein [Myxococcales bacterium]|nr:PLP-dependent aminotransferase family protein [Myxococcales bacterium]
MYRLGDKLPSIRKLRRERGLSTSTVTQALAELERRGVVEARPRSGYFVRPPDTEVSKPGLERYRLRPRRVPLPHLADAFVSASADTGMVPLGGAVLSPDLLPLKLLTRAARATASKGARAFASYGPPAGAVELRRVLARRLLGLGMPVSADEIVISAGCMDAIRLALLAVTRPSDVVALESPTFFGFLQIVRDLGLYALEIPTRPEHGMDLDALERAMARHRLAAIIVTPTFQNPTGACMPTSARRRLAAIAQRHRATIVEDDVYGDLAFSAERPPPVASLGLADVVYCSSLSKTLAPGLRLGWTVPGEYLDRVRRLKLSGTITSPALDQLTAVEVLESGAYDRHLRGLRRALRHQVGAMRRALATHLPAGTEITDPEGGFLLWVKLPEGSDGHVLHERAAEHRVSVLPGTLCSVDDKFRRHLRINAGYPWSETIEAAVRVVGQLARSASRRSSG